MGTSLATLTGGSKADVLARLQSMHNRIQRVRAEAEGTTERMVLGAVGLAGAGASGVLQAKLAKVPGTEIRSDAALGGLAIIGGILGLAGKRSDEAVVFGLCCAAPFLAEETRARLS